jgi:hypothetical protein
LNRVVGTFGTNAGGDNSDVFTYEIPSGYHLDRIVLTYSDPDPGDNGSYMAIQGGTVLGSGLPTVGQNLSNALVNSSGDLMIVFASGPTYGGTGLSSPLPAGVYTVGLHEIHSVIDYTLDFQVSLVPEPSSLSALLSAMALPLLRRRRPGGPKDD